MSLIEVLVAVGVILIIVLGIITSFGLLLRYGLSNIERTQAVYLAEEGVEAIKIIRDTSFDNLSSLSLDTDYSFEFTGNTWVSTTTPEYIDEQFLRTFNVGEVKRDSNDDISDAGTVDPNILLLEVEVEWKNRTGTSTERIITYITNLFDE